MAAPDSAKPTSPHDICEDGKRKACSKDPFVVFMLQKLAAAGCPVDVDRHVLCTPCGANLNGAFDAERNQIMLCENAIYSEKQLASTLTHELIHAYDHCRGHVDFADSRHLACTEIRASSLSGDCFWWKEWFDRLQFGFQGQHQRCVKRRAALSVAAVTGKSREECLAVVEEMFPICFADTRPFDRVP